MLNSDGVEIDTGLDALMAQAETKPIVRSPASGSQETDETFVLNSDGLEIDAGIDALMARYNVVYK
jgi:hypothetical protein